MAIKVLDKHVSELIAAGEVIERPASVVKELVENAIDAGAAIITVEIKRGGLALIRVADNGAGVERADVPTAFLRHGTSKMSCEDDLYRITTLGFRGEALCSIAAVSRVTCITRTAAETAATVFEIDGGGVGKLSDGGAPVGTTMVVKDLFYNTPARMKFLKKDSYEASAVAGLVDKLALSYPGISFRFIKDGKEELFTPGDGQLKSAVAAVFGRLFAESLLPVEEEQGGVRIGGYISKPSACKGSRSAQHFYVNGRFVKSASCAAALEEAYKHAVMVGRFPGCVLNIELSPELVDVNVHPTKTQVRFVNDRAVFSAVYLAAKNALIRGNDVGELTLVNAASRPSKTGGEGPLDKASKDVKGNYYTQEKDDPFALDPNRKQPAVTAAQPWAQAIWQTPAPTPVPAPARPMPCVVPPPCKAPPAPRPDEGLAAAQGFSRAVDINIVREEEEQTLSLIGEAFGTYILAARKDEIIVIDKHAAHERILYDRLKAAERKGDAQLLLEPVVVTLGQEDCAFVLEHAALFSEAGFDIDDCGSGSVIVRGVPQILSREEVGGTLSDAIDAVRGCKQEAEFSRLDEILHSVACRAAVKSHDRTSTHELLVLAARVMDEKIRHCPHGRPVAMRITKKSLEKQFGRT